LYWLIPAVTASLIGGVVNAWLFLIRVRSWSRSTPPAASGCVELKE
jgi:hypothetical protein